MLLNQGCLRPFIMSLQTQLLLHGLHLHLMVSETNCPLYNKKPISEFITQCSVIVQNHAYTNGPRVSILLHNLAPVNALVLNIWSYIQISCIDNAHVISAIASKNIDGKITYEFFVPVSIRKEYYNLAITFSNTVNEVRIVHEKLSNCKSMDVSYSFNQQIKCYNSSSAGNLGFGMCCNTLAILAVLSL